MTIASKEVLDGIKEFDSATMFNAVVESMGGSQGGTELEGRGGVPIVFTDPTLRCLLPDLGTAVGYAVTCEVTALDPDSAKIDWHEYYDLLDETAAPIVGVIKDIDSRAGRGAVLGDGMAGTHKLLGVTGIVVDGSVRDLAGIEQVGIPAWGKGLVPGHGVFNLIRTNIPVVVAGLLIHPGDLLICDRDGVTQIPKDMDPAVVLDMAREIRERELSYQKRFVEPGMTWAKLKEIQLKMRG
jgi:regulator of RNase E activity RraA